VKEECRTTSNDFVNGGGWRNRTRSADESESRGGGI